MNAIIYYLINILLFPITVIGNLIMTISFIASRNSKVSGTALSPLVARWLLHNLGSRKDEPANRLMVAISGISVSLALGPMILAHRVSGYVPKEYRLPLQGEITLGNQGWFRQTFYDDIVEQYLPDIPQFVILGAGFDTRALKLNGKPECMNVRSFEIDTSATLEFKRVRLSKAKIDASNITFVSADFEKDNWLDKLIQSGFDLEQSALFIWEGVTPYLDETAVRDTLRKVASLAKGSIIAFDYFSSEVIESKALAMRSIRASLSAGGEPLKFGLESTPPLSDRVVELLLDCGLTLVSQLTAGQEGQGKRAWGGFAVAIVK